jgi:hypothetical protein
VSCATARGVNNRSISYTAGSGAWDGEETNPRCSCRMRHSIRHGSVWPRCKGNAAGLSAPLKTPKVNAVSPSTRHWAGGH